MKASNLNQFDKSFLLKIGNPESSELIGISNSNDPKESTITFVKNKKFLNKVGELNSSSSFLKTGLILEEKFFSSLDNIQDLSDQFLWIGTVESIDQAMCFLSKPFYDQKFSHLNHQVDGRQLNLVEIDPSAEISQGVFIGAGAKIGKNVKILPGSVIMPEVTIGDNSLIFPNVTIYPYTEIGSGCRVHSGTVIGSDGFGYNFFDGSHNKIWHFSGVIIGKNVEIGANSMIDCGAFTPTIIGEGTIIDNDVQIAHNTKTGKFCVLCGKAGLAGSVELKDFVIMGAGAGCAPGAKLETGVQVAARAIVSENTHVKAGEVLGGHPARPIKEWLKAQATVRRLMKK